MAQTHETMSLYELRELATRQQERIETTQKLIHNREQKLKLLKHDQNLSHTISEYDKNLHLLKESVNAQELKLRQLRALKGQVQKQRCSSSNICSELESIRTLFGEKEKELSVALTKVDALTRQLEELRKGNTTNSYHMNGISNGKHSIELEKLRQELLYRSKLSEQNGHELMLKRGLLTARQSEMVGVDKRISELQQRLARKRQINQQLSSQMHTNLILANNIPMDENGLQLSNAVLRSSVGHNGGHRHKMSHTMRPLSANINIAAVEPVLREQTARVSEFDPHIKANAQDFMGCKQDPKYQTLPYNMKIGVRQQSSQPQYQPQYNQMSVANQLCVSTPDSDRLHCQQLSDEKLLSTNCSLNNDNNNNNHNNNVSIITNNINSNQKLLMNTKSSVMEERPSPSGSSGSSDRASIQNHNGIIAYKMQQQMQNSINNSNSAQHPYQNLNPKMYNTTNYYDPNGNQMNKQSKANLSLHSNQNIISNNKLQMNSINPNQSVIQSVNVPTNSPNQTQSQFASNPSKVPPISKPKPIVPPKPSVPVKPIPPPRQTPNHSFSAQIHNESVDTNAYSTNTNRHNTNSYSKKSPNLSTNSNASINTSNSGYNRLPLTSLAIQKTYNAINSKSGLMIQQLPHHCQQQQQQHQLIHQSYEDRIQSHLNRNTSDSLHQLSNLNETTDGSNGSHLNGPEFAMTASADITSSTSSTSSLSSSLSSQNNANNCDNKSIISTTVANITDNNYSLNSTSLQSKSSDDRDNRDCAYGTVKANSNNNSTVSNVSTISTINNNNNNNLSDDWHKVKRRPVVANNEIEQELALQVSADGKKSIESESNICPISQPISQALQSEPRESREEQLSDCIKVESNESKGSKNKIDFDLRQTKSDESVDKDNESDINLIKERDKQLKQEKEETTREGLDSNSMIEENKKNKEKDCDDKSTTDNLLSNYTPNSKSIVGAKRAKGNLKCQQLNSKEDQQNNSSNGTHPLVVSRRVSFDPLALLLDAALEGELELVKKTAKEVPNPSAANDEGITALHNAICAGHFDIVKFLVETGCDVNAQDSDGWTPLHCAASCNNLGMVKFLVENGACIFATTLSDQETAAEKCEEDEEGFDGCSQYLYGVQEKLGILNASQVYAVYDYESQNSDELSFKEGNVIIVMRKGDEQEREWWWAKIRDREGYVPRNLLGLYPRVKTNKELQTIAEEHSE